MAQQASAGHSGGSWLVNFPLPLHDPHYEHINGALVVFGVITVVSVLAHLRIKKDFESHVIPGRKVSLVTIVDILTEFLRGMVTGTLGEGGMKYFPFIASVFVFILLGNLLGLTPNGSAPTSNFNTSLSLGVASFLYYNIMGIREHGLIGYMKHFLMGLGIVGVPIAFLEIISHAIRPVSLSIRLFVNMFVDHTVVLSFQELVAWLLPVPLLLLGLIVSMIQAFVFAMLTAVYVKMATEHEH